MKPKIKLSFTVFLCSISSVLIAKSVDINTVKAITEHQMAAISGSSLKLAGSTVKHFQLSSEKATVENNDTLYFILNDTINKGFVIVSADQRAWPIQGYSTEGSFNEKNNQKLRPPGGSSDSTVELIKQNTKIGTYVTNTSGTAYGNEVIFTIISSIMLENGSTARGNCNNIFQSHSN